MHLCRSVIRYGRESKLKFHNLGFVPIRSAFHGAPGLLYRRHSDVPSDVTAHSDSGWEERVRRECCYQAGGSVVP